VVEITVHKKPVARIYPVFEESAAFMAELKRQCIISENITEDDGLEALQDWSD
jgi:antitoxin (DNA-binding transcriptional repressor) of toxin-antitoxin stability system